AGEGVHTVELLLGIEVVLRSLQVNLKRGLVDGNVDGPPPDILLRGRALDYALVLGGSAGLGTRVGDEGAQIGDGTVRVITDGFRVKFGRRKIASDVLNRNAVRVNIESRHGCFLYLVQDSPQKPLS